MADCIHSSVLWKKTSYEEQIINKEDNSKIQNHCNFTRICGWPLIKYFLNEHETFYSEENGELPCQHKQQHAACFIYCRKRKADMTSHFI